MTTATVPNTTALRRSLTLVATHLDAGHADPHDPKYPKYVTDLGSLITNARRAGDKTDLPHSSEREKLSYLVRNASTHEEIGDIMGRLDAIAAKLTAADQTARDEAAQVAAHFARLQDQVATLQTTIDGLIAGQVTDAEIDALGAQVDAIADTVEKIDTEGDEGPVEPPVEPTP